MGFQFGIRVIDRHFFMKTYLLIDIAFKESCKYNNGLYLKINHLLDEIGKKNY